MFCSVRPWKQASTLALAFACISACQNISFAAELNKAKSVSLGLEAQASALTVDLKSKPAVVPANVATEVKNTKIKTSPGPKVDKVSTTSKSSTSDKNNSKNSSDKKVSDADANKTATTKTARKPRHKSIGLVPPPPPSMPTFLNTTNPISGSFDLGLSVNYMSLDDLKYQQKTLEKKLEAARLDDKDQKRSTGEKKERAKRFVELYQEGVVSRRELETAQDESERALRDIEQTHIKVSEIERVLGQVKERISSMEAAKRPFKVSSKKSKTR